MQTVLRAVLAIPAIVCLTFAADSSAFNGTWKLNLAKSKFESAAPKSMTVIITDTGTTVEETRPSGEQIKWSYMGKDGESVPIQGMQNASVTSKSVDAKTVEHTWKMGEGAPSTGRGVLSADGRTMTYTSKGTTPEGKAYTNVMILEKQK